jgi:hypothetical protein
MKQILFYFITIFITTTALSQSCDVYVDSLKGQYTGGCKDGEANGNGTAKGTDSYIGNFKNGYPDGEGKYTWKNGSTYEGSWKNGLFDGVGTLNKVDNTTGKSIVMSGFWKKGNYVEKHDKPYVVHILTNNITDASVRKINTNGSEVTINVKCITGGASNVMNQHLPKARLVDIQQIEGRFEQQVADESASLISNKYTLRNVTFPFYAIFSFETKNDTKFDSEKVGVELFEDGTWNIQVNIDN